MASHRQQVAGETRVIHPSKVVETFKELEEFMDRIRDAAPEDSRVRFEFTIRGQIKRAFITWGV